MKQIFKQVKPNNLTNSILNITKLSVNKLINISKYNYSSLNMKFSSISQTVKNNFYKVNSKDFTSLPRHKKLTLPNLSPSMDKGTVVEWKKKEGDKFTAGESIAGIETDKAVVDFEMNEDGYIAKILKPAGSKDVPLGTLIAITVDNLSDVAAFKNFSEGSAVQSPAQAQPQIQTQVNQNSPQKTSYPRHRKLVLPSLSPSMERVSFL